MLCRELCTYSHNHIIWKEEERDPFLPKSREMRVALLLGGALVGGTEIKHFDPRHGRPRDHPAVWHHHADEEPMPGSLGAITSS